MDLDTKEMSCMIDDVEHTDVERISFSKFMVPDDANEGKMKPACSCNIVRANKDSREEFFTVKAELETAFAELFSKNK